MPVMAPVRSDGICGAAVLTNDVTLCGVRTDSSGVPRADVTVDAVPPQQFEQWASAARNSGPVLDAQTYAELAKPSEAVAAFTYRAIAPGLFNTILNAGSLDDALYISPTH